MGNTPHLYFAALHSLGLSQRKLRDIVDPYTYWNTLSVKKLQESGYSFETAEKIVDKKSEKIVEDVEQKLKKYDIQVIHKDDTLFPSLLREIHDCPTILYVRGELRDTPLLSVVGSRNHSQYAQASLARIIPEMVQAGYGIVSGGAYGIDSIAHSCALKNNGYTIAVFGSGIDEYYPASNADLFSEIVDSGGALISQFPLTSLAEPYHFPIRNAVVAGISRGTLIAEAGLNSGTLITARLALEYNRDVFIIPADISRESALGSNGLIRDGLGKLITGAADILSEYGFSPGKIIPREFDHPLQAQIYNILEEPLPTDTIVDQLQEESIVVMQHLALMEIEGSVEQQGGLYRRN